MEWFIFFWMRGDYAFFLPCKNTSRCFHTVLESIVFFFWKNPLCLLLLGILILLCFCWILEIIILFAFKIRIFLQFKFEPLTQIVVGEHCYGANATPSSFMRLTRRRCRLHKLWWKDNEQAATRGWLFDTFCSHSNVGSTEQIFFLKDYQFTSWLYCIMISIFNSYWPQPVILLGLHCLLSSFIL